MSFLLMGAGDTGSISTWTPTSLPNLLAWYKADVGVYSDLGFTSCPTATRAVQWNDQSGNGYNLIRTPSSSNCPTFQSGGLNSKPTLVFNAASHNGMITAAGVAWGTGTSGSAFFIGTMTTNTNAFGRALAYVGPSSADVSTGSFIPVIRNNATSATYAEKGATTNNATPSSVSLATEARFGGVANGSTVNSYINGVAGTSAAVTDSAISAGYIGVGTSVGSGGVLGTVSWDGAISEIIFTKDAMTPTNIALLDAYLVARW